MFLDQPSQANMSHESLVTIIPGGHIGYKMIDNQQGTNCQVGYNHLISNKRKWNIVLLKMPQKTKKTKIICK